jgi:hypothetical protein
MPHEATREKGDLSAAGTGTSSIQLGHYHAKNDRARLNAIGFAPTFLAIRLSRDGEPITLHVQLKKCQQRRVKFHSS